MKAALAPAVADGGPALRVNAETSVLQAVAVADDVLPFVDVLARTETAAPVEEAPDDDAEDSTTSDAKPLPLFLLAAHFLMPDVKIITVNAEPSKIVTEVSAAIAEPPKPKPMAAADAVALPETNSERTTEAAGRLPQAVPDPKPSVTREDIGAPQLPRDAPAPMQRPDSKHSQHEQNNDQPDDRLKPIKIEGRTEPGPPDTVRPAVQAAAISHPAVIAAPVAQQLAERLPALVSDGQRILRVLEAHGQESPVVRTLQFSLRPETLGELRVTLRLSGETMKLSIETRSDEARRALEQDRPLLDSLLQSSGIATDRGQIDIRLGRFEPAPSGAPQQSPLEGHGSAGQGSFTGQGQSHPKDTNTKDGIDVSASRPSPDTPGSGSIYL